MKGTTAIRIIIGYIAVMFMGSTLVTPMYVLYQNIYHFSELTLTLIYAAYVIGNLVALFFFGRLSDSFGRKRVSMPILAIAGLSTLVFLTSHGIPSLFVGRILSGLAIGIASGTGTAWLVELIHEKDNRKASVIATGSNMLGLAIGPLMGGFLGQYAPYPLRLSFAIYFILLIIGAFLISRTPETITNIQSFRDVSLRPRFGVPREIFRQFLSPAITAFSSFALVGFYAALVPTILSQILQIKNLAVGGAIIFELFFISAVTVVASKKVNSQTAMYVCLTIIIPSVAFLSMAQIFRSFLIMIIGTALSGIASAFGYRGTLQIINQIAPAERRAEVISSYLIFCFLGNSLPIIGVGIFSKFFSPLSTNISFAALDALIAIIALVIGIKFPPLQETK